jgi:hypothetical protein
MHLNKKIKGGLAFIIVLIALRVALPYIVLHFSNKTLKENIEGYTGNIEDVDIALYRGAYRIKNLKIEAVDNGVMEPFLEIPAIDLSVQWKAIFNGAFTGEVVLEQPKVVFAFSSSGTAVQTGEEVDWVTVIQDFMPITINRFAVEGGTAVLENAWEEPKVDLTVENVEFELLNIRNVESKGAELPSPFTASANFPGYGGTFTGTGGANLLKTVPDFNYDARLENFQLVKANEIMKFYSGLDFEKGTISVFSELAMADGKFKGYVKPILKDVKIFALNEGDRNIGQFFGELFSEGLKELLENHAKDQLASRVPIEGTVEAPETGVWTAILSVLRNAYINAFRPKIDETVEYDDALNPDGEEDKPGLLKRIFSGKDKDKDKKDKDVDNPADTTKKEGLLKRIF